MAQASLEGERVQLKQRGKPEKDQRTGLSIRKYPDGFGTNVTLFLQRQDHSTKVYKEPSGTISVEGNKRIPAAIVEPDEHSTQPAANQTVEFKVETDELSVADREVRLSYRNPEATDVYTYGNSIVIDRDGNDLV